MKRGPGRPPLPRQMRRTEKVVISLTPAEYQRYLVTAARKGLTMTKYIRKLLREFSGVG